MPTTQLHFTKESHSIVIDEQSRLKKLRGVGQFSIESTVLKIIKEWELWRKERETVKTCEDLTSEILQKTKSGSRV